MLDVWADDLPSGLLNRGDAWKHSFTYRPDCRAAQAVSVKMPVRPESWVTRAGLHPIFDQNLPEGTLRAWFESTVAKTLPDYNDLELLRITGQSQIGRLRYTSKGEPLPTEDIPCISLDDVLRTAGTADLFSDLMGMYARHSGISGAQPKVMVLARGDTEAARRDGMRLTVRMPTHIVKTWQPAEYPELALNEYLCMKAAERSGIPCAVTELSDDRVFLIVHRFDRGPDGSFKGFEDCCVLMDKTSRQKYSGTYEQVVKAMKLYTASDNRPDALFQVFKMVALSVILRNGDAHLKNFGILYDSPVGRQSEIAPAFDLVTTTPYLPNDALALTLNGTKRWPGKKQLEAFGRTSCGFSAAEVRTCLEDVERGAATTLEEVRAWAKEEPAFRQVGKAMFAAWDAGLCDVCSKKLRVFDLAASAHGEEDSPLRHPDI